MWASLLSIPLLLLYSLVLIPRLCWHHGTKHSSVSRHVCSDDFIFTTINVRVALLMVIRTRDTLSLSLSICPQRPSSPMVSARMSLRHCLGRSSSTMRAYRHATNIETYPQHWRGGERQIYVGAQWRGGESCAWDATVHVHAVIGATEFEAVLFSCAHAH